MKKKKQNKSQFGRDFVARAEYLAGAPTPTPTKKGKLQKMERKNKSRHGRADDGSYHFNYRSIGKDRFRATLN